MKSTSPAFTVEIPGSRDRKRQLERVFQLADLCDICFLKTTQPPTVCLMAARSFALTERPVLSEVALLAFFFLFLKFTRLNPMNAWQEPRDLKEHLSHTKIW